MSNIERLNLLRGTCPIGWTTISTHGRGWKVIKDLELGFYGWTSRKIIERIRKYKDYDIFPKIIWMDKDYSRMIREWIPGLNWKIYMDKHGLSQELAEWYIYENYKYWKITGGHGDFVWYNIIITPNRELRWIDINHNGDSFITLVRQLHMHVRRTISVEEIERMLQEP